ncbi:MAG TPA: peptidylprolyl isomerase [Saprospiraceae bacterium]|nr:peptidylprolyl isomerase [Saprospiraceae bacterium]HMP25325.1 peptidylprolyl isomerase [Saprospiraceae bacterium]
MILRIITLVLLVAVWPLLLSAQQQQDPVLFTVGDTPVHLSEFTYIYSKTNGQNADFSQKSLEEYLDLYVRFKLKVKEARQMQVDTIPSLKAELAGYRKQLADSYLIDREVTDKLVRELYERAKEDVDVSHIFVQIGEVGINPMPEDSAAAYAKITAIRKRLDQGETFEKLVQELSEDEGANSRNGNIGWLTAPLPNGFYDLENAIYNQPIGKPGKPVRTRLGYHIAVVNRRRPARGEVEVAHVLARAQEGNFEAAKARIDSAYAALQQGRSFEEVTGNFSDDKTTADRGGYLGIFGIGRYEKAFEDAAFALDKDGAYSAPIRTSIGWHIIRRISKREIQPFETEKTRLETKIKQDSRFDLARVAMLERIRRENDFKVYSQVLQNFVNAQDSAAFFSFRWKASMDDPEQTIFTLGTDTRATLGEFVDFMNRAVGKRIRYNDQGVATAVQGLYQEFLNDACLRFEEAHLEEKYPEFRSLMREYEEGILLFEATKMVVWDRASQDTVGLEAFYETVKERYQWSERARISTFKIAPESRAKVNEIYTYAQTHTPEETLSHFNTAEQTIVTLEEKTIERKAGTTNVWIPGEVGRLQINRDGTGTFDKIMEVIPPKLKTLQEARGYIIADYQDYLERQWVETLRKQYPVVIQQQVLKSLIKA